MNEALNPSYPIMVVDDEEAILLAMDTALRMAGMNNIITSKDGREVMDILSRQKIEVMLLDLTMPHIHGEDILRMVTRDFPEIPIIIVTGTVDVETAVQCMKSGAFNYLVKPVEEGCMVTAVSNAIAFRELKRENMSLKQRILSDTLEHPETFAGIITNNKKMISLFRYVEAIARTSQPVLITGETGVGKELIAGAIHALSGKGAFTAVNVAGLDDHVFSDTLFGHVKGAFTGADSNREGMLEQASGGTFFLDEIGELSPASQVKLLRLLQEGEYLPLGLDHPRHTNARILAATNRDLWSLQEAGKFRKDLFYRLQTHHIHIPPLRERMDDIQKPTPPKELFTLLRTYSFPGNVRELRSMIFDAVSTHTSRILSMKAFKSHIARKGERVVLRKSDPEKTPLITFFGELPTLKEGTELIVAEALKRANGNQSVAAQLLGISQQALSKRLKNSAV
ncbi:MAG: sigma-54-dependent Fis family transcriptional regulator [Deltaproteobacteria bacterium]|nr:sigma-54-dependent Fis family transcriptional regulator [Deltaproteobacteria bacterium]